MRDIRPADQDVYDLPFDPATRDIVCRRETITLVSPALGEYQRTTLHYNVPRRHVHHSPSGWEWNYGGSGPSDFALNIVAFFIGPAPDPGPEPDEESSFTAWEVWADRNDQRVKLWDGTYVHADAWRLHFDFTRRFVATLPREGGTISGADIQTWIDAQLSVRGAS